MEVLIGNVEALIVMYLPIFLSTLTPIINWFTVIKHFENSIKDDADIKKMLKQVIQDNLELKRENRQILEQLTHVKVKDDANFKNKKI